MLLLALPRFNRICFVIALLAFSACAEKLMAEKYKLSVCAIFRNEASCLEEWIEYHRIVGVDHFYLYNNGSVDDSVDVLAPYVKEGLVTLVDWPNRLPSYLMDSPGMWALSTQLLAYENTTKNLAVNDTQWLAILEIDEFIVPVEGRSIGEVLDRFDQYPGIAIAKEHYNASQNCEFFGKKLVTETLALTEAPKEAIENTVEKLIFKPKSYTSFTWPPYRCCFKDNQLAKKLHRSELRINQYVNRPKGSLFFGKPRNRAHVDNRMLTEEETLLLLKNGSDIEDQERAIYRFRPHLLKKLGRHLESI